MEASASSSTQFTETSPLLVDSHPNSSTEKPSKSSSSLNSPPNATCSCDRTNRADSQDDEEALLQDASSNENARNTLDRAAIARVILILLIAVFVYHADQSLVLATHPRIASEFNALEWSSWLFISFGLAGATTQAMMGKLSDIFGRKPIILLCYTGFAAGCVIVALAPSMPVVILGRVISGSVGSGLTVLVSVLITDLVPIRESASWRSYVNIVATTGRSFGGPLGGWLADAVGWRWSFGFQAPMLAIALILCWRNLPRTMPKRKVERQENNNNDSKTVLQKLARIDFLGAMFLAGFVLCLLLPLELGGEKVPWTHPLIPGLFIASATLLIFIILAEKYWASDPILNLAVFSHRDVVLSYGIMMLQSAAQAGMMFSVPLYFQITQRVSNTEAGARMFPAVVGNAVGGMLSGILIKRTGEYKWLLYLGTFSSAVSYTLLLTRWHGHTNWAESLYILPGGLGMGIASSALFVVTQAAVDSKYMTAAVTTLFLSGTVGAIIGVACVSTTLHGALQSILETKLYKLGFDGATRLAIISKVVSSVDYVHELKGPAAKAVVSSYIVALFWTHVVSLSFVALGFILVLLVRKNTVQR